MCEIGHTTVVFRDPPKQATYRFHKVYGAYQFGVSVRFKIGRQIHDPRLVTGMSEICGTFMPPAAYQHRAQSMRTYLPNLSATAWALIALPALVAARCVAVTVVPQVVHAVVPEVVRSVLRII